MSSLIVESIVVAEATASKRTIYVRTGGTGDGSSAVNALGSMEEAFDALPRFSRNQKIRVDSTGYDWTVPSEARNIPSIMSGESNHLDVGGAGGDYYDPPLEFFAAPTLVQSLTITGVTPDAKLLGRAAVDVSETLTPGAHVDQWIFGGNIAQFGIVISNTASQLIVQGQSGIALAAGSGLYTLSSTWDVGGVSFDDFKLSYAPFCSTVFNGIAFDDFTVSTAASYCTFAACQLKNATFYGAGRTLNLQNCLIKDGTLVMDSVLCWVKACVMRNQTFATDGSLSAEENVWQDCTLDAVTDFGGNWLLTDWSAEIRRTFIDNAVGNGVNLLGAGRSRVRNCTIQNSSGHGILARDGTVWMEDTDGTGNGEYGVALQHKSQVVLLSGTPPSVTGTSGDTRIGEVAATWAEIATARALGEGIDDAHIGENSTTHWNLQTNLADGWMGGFYDFDTGNNDFSPSVNWGTANVAYGAHVGFVQGAVSGDEITIRVTGTSFLDDGTETPADTEDVVIAAGAVDRYFETAKKWTGQVTIETVAGTAVVFNYGWVKYWDHRNQDFRVEGVEAIWESDSTDSTSDITVIHHSAAGWTYQAANGPLHVHLAQRSSDYTNNAQRVGQGAWKRTDLMQDVIGSASEGVLIHIESGNIGLGTLSFRSLNVVLDIRTGLTGETRQFCRIAAE